MVLDEKLMDVHDVAKYIGLSEFTIRRLAKEGALPAAKFGRSYRFKRDDIDGYMRQQYERRMEAIHGGV